MIALDFVDRLIVVVEQGIFPRVALNTTNGIINSIAKTNVIFLLQVNFCIINS
jgi:hypothetical protein